MLATATTGPFIHTAAALGRCDVADLTYDAVEQETVRLINEYRAQNGAPALGMSPSLNRAASWLAVDMGDKNYLSHTDALGRDPFQRMANCDVASSAGQAENVAAGYATAADVFKGWKDSPGHNANMLNASYRSIGVPATTRRRPLTAGTGRPTSRPRSSTAPRRLHRRLRLRRSRAPRRRRRLLR